MKIDIPNLFIEINHSNYIFVAGVYNNNHELVIIEKIITSNDGINKNKFIDIFSASKTIKKNVEIIEKKINHIFKEVTIIIENFNYSCINVSGFKKLNGSQILKENISYILNSLKLSISENEKQKTILHIFNSKSILDGNDVVNLPIGLFGDFYNHELTFFLIENNDLKNIKKIFDTSNLQVKKLILKNFSDGTQLINKNNIETFFKIKINKEISSIIFFNQSSFRYSENFNFGTNIILEDIVKVCSLEKEVVMNLLFDNFLFDKKYNENEFIEEKYFTKGVFRKIRKKLILDIINARIEEISDLIFNKNINFKFLKKKDIQIFLTFEDMIFSNNFKNFFSKESNLEPNLIKDSDVETSFAHAGKLAAFGWKKEAIPISQTKNSLITRIFNSIFG